MFKTKLLEHSKILGGTKKIWGNCPRIPHRVWGSGNRRQKVFHWGLHVSAGGLDILKMYF